MNDRERIKLMVGVAKGSQLMPGGMTYKRDNIAELLQLRAVVAKFVNYEAAILAKKFDEHSASLNGAFAEARALFVPDAELQLQDYFDATHTEDDYEHSPDCGTKYRGCASYHVALFKVFYRSPKPTKPDAMRIGQRLVETWEACTDDEKIKLAEFMISDTARHVGLPTAKVKAGDGDPGQHVIEIDFQDVMVRMLLPKSCKTTDFCRKPAIPCTACGSYSCCEDHCRETENDVIHLGDQHTHLAICGFAYDAAGGRLPGHGVQLFAGNVNCQVCLDMMAAGMTWGPVADVAGNLAGLRAAAAKKMSCVLAVNGKQSQCPNDRCDVCDPPLRKAYTSYIDNKIPETSKDIGLPADWDGVETPVVVDAPKEENQR